MKKICFTGHRPNKLGGYDWNTFKNKAIMKELRCQIIEIMNNTDENEFKFICGGALGIDQMAFKIVEDLKYSTLKFNPCSIILELAIPFEKQASAWFKKEDVDRYNHQKEIANICTYVDTLEDYKLKDFKEEVYYPAKMQKRNEYMVDNSDIIIVVWDGIKKGGTWNCVKYAEKQGKEIIRINPKEI